MDLSKETIRRQDSCTDIKSIARVDRPEHYRKSSAMSSLVPCTTGSSISICYLLSANTVMSRETVLIVLASSPNIAKDLQR